MNGMPKYVASSTLERAEWNNSTIIREDLGAAVQQMKAEMDDDILVAGSASLVRSLLSEGLVDELRLMVYPVVLGGGKRLFDDSGPGSSFALASVAKAGETAILTYRRAS
jgi:dihydrofolate reductase